MVILAAKTVYQNIKNDSTESLHKYYSHCVSVFGCKPYDGWKYSGIPYNYARGVVALNILKERLGDDYVLKLQGLSKPETFKEKLKYFLFNVYLID